jgi:hypothetical protein
MAERSPFDSIVAWGQDFAATLRRSREDIPGADARVVGLYQLYRLGRLLDPPHGFDWAEAIAAARAASAAQPFFADYRIIRGIAWVGELCAAIAERWGLAPETFRRDDFDPGVAWSEGYFGGGQRFTVPAAWADAFDEAVGMVAEGLAAEAEGLAPVQAETTGEEHPGAVVTPDHAHVVAALRSRGLRTQAALVAYMLARKKAPFCDVKKEVHEDPDVSDGAVRQRVSETKKNLVEFAPKITLRTEGRWVYLDELPE